MHVRVRARGIGVTQWTSFVVLTEHHLGRDA